MVNKCVVFGCNSGYSTCKENVSSFRFPAEKPELLQKWIKFVNRADFQCFQCFNFFLYFSIFSVLVFVLFSVPLYCIHKMY